MRVRHPPSNEPDFLVMAPESLRARTLPGLNLKLRTADVENES
jgi:hypothetical protein